jgi:hypothetical protein
MLERIQYPILWFKAKWSDLLFHYRFKRAPVIVMGNCLVKEVNNNLYVVGTINE